MEKFNQKIKSFGSKVKEKAGMIYAGALMFVTANFGFVTYAYADNNTLANVLKLLSGGICCLGGGLVIWGLVQLGMGWKDGSGGGGQINGALGFIIGGAAVFGAGLLLGNLDTSWINV